MKSDNQNLYGIVMTYYSHSMYALYRENCRSIETDSTTSRTL